jgi:AcrR family transcriptional regulator
MSPRAGLDRAAVVAAAAELINTEGIEALTLGRLAERLGVRTPSLYNHVDGIPGLYRELALMNVRLMGARLGEAAMGRSGAEGLMAVAQAYRAYIKECPGLYLASLRAAGVQTPVDVELQAAEEQVVKIAMAVVASFGLSGEDGLHAVRGLRSIVHGFATLELAGGFGLPLDCDESFRRLVTLFIRGLQQPKGKGRQP